MDSLRQGRVVVTNGPCSALCLRATSGHTFRATAVKRCYSTESEPDDCDPISYLEVVQNGSVVQTVRLKDYAATGQLPPGM